MDISIYGLVAPGTQEVRYVGRTKQPLKLRLAQHVHQARRKKDGSWKFTNPRIVWIRSLLDEAKRPDIILLESVPEHQQREVEARHMLEYENLVNSASAEQGGTRSYVVDWTPELDARLGVDVDAIIADELGVTRKAVSYRRRVLGIPAANDRTRNVPPPNKGGWNRIELSPEIIKQFGQLPDQQLADQAGVGKTIIAKARRKLGIASYSEVYGSPTQYRKGQPHPRWSKRR